MKTTNHNDFKETTFVADTDLVCTQMSTGIPASHSPENIKHPSYFPFGGVEENNTEKQLIHNTPKHHLYGKNNSTGHFFG